MKKGKVIIISVLFLTAVVTYFAFFWQPYYSNQNDAYITDEKLVKIAGEEEASLKLVEGVLDNPDQLIRLNSRIRRLIYSGDKYEKNKIDETEIENLIKLQRRLFHEDLLEENPLAFHMLEVKKELKIWEENGLQIIGSEQLAPVNVEYKKEAVYVPVVFYTNVFNVDEYENAEELEKFKQIYVEYGLIKDANGYWKIYGWWEGDEFEILK